MRLGYLVFNLDGMGGTSRSAITQACALAGEHDVTLISVVRTASAPHYVIDPRIHIDYLVDLRDRETPGAADVSTPMARLLHARESVLVPARWDRQFTALCDVALEARLPRLDVDVLVTVTPGLLAAAVELTPDPVVIVHQEHRSTNERTSGLEPLLVYAPRADVVALLSPANEEWLREQLGALTPPTVVLPNPLPLGFAPRSALDAQVIMSAGRLVPEKQFTRLVDSFAQIAPLIPGWRLRICGEGPQRVELQRQIRKYGLWDRVELPGSLPDLSLEWPQASVAALTSRTEGFPLVVQEAMAAGLPVASYDCPSGPREIIEHGVNGLLVGPQSIAGMAAALLRLTTDEELRRRLGRGAVHTARSYDAHTVAERWVGVFGDARARRAGKARLRARVTAPIRRPAVDPTASLTAAPITPARARHEAMRLAVQAAEAASDAWLAVPRHQGPHPTLIVAMSARAAFLDALAALEAPAYLCLRDPAENGWPQRRGPIAETARELRRGMTNQLMVEPWPTLAGEPTLIGEGATVAVQFWETSTNGELIAPDRNAYADRIPAHPDVVEVEIDGVTCRSLDLMVAPTATECRFPIDVVYTWVDGHDPVWNHAREQRLAALSDSTTRGATARTRESSGRARFIDRGELRFSLRSLDLFAPWVRRIHLVTAGQTPAWLDPTHPRINVVDHRDLLPPEALPTFNSHAIETSLHRIEGLAEHFVYFNDDFLLGRSARPESFFNAAGLPAVFFSHTAVGLDDQPDAPPFLKAALNNRALLREAFGAVALRNLAHAPYALRVSTVEMLWRDFPQAMAATARSPFRDDTDVATLSSLAQYYGLLSARAVEAEADVAFVNLANADIGWQLRKLRRRDQDFLCLGDHHDHAVQGGRLDRMLADFFTDYYPIAAPWERPV